ncbi:MAG: response regulator [Lachnospiraceae bacterium]|nr:response regulator [Lachnospiraceae bacterium]
MDKSSKEVTIEDRPGKVIRGVWILFLAVLFTALAGLFYFSSIDHSDPLQYREPDFIEEWTVKSPSGHVIEAGSSYRNEDREQGAFVMVSKLPERITDDSYFCFIVGGDVSVYINGELRKNFVAARDVIIPGGCVKRFYMRVPLTPADGGADVRIIRLGTTRGGYVYQNTFVASGSDFLAYMMSNYGTSLMLEELLMIFALVIIAVSLVMIVLYRRQIKMLYGALSILVIAGWLITNSFLYPFLYGHYHIDGVLNYMLCLMMPFSMVFYIDALQQGRYRKIMRAVLCVAAVNLIVWPILHFTETIAFPEALLYIDAFLGLELLTVAGVMITDLIRGGMKDYKYTAIGFAGFFVCGLGEIVVLNFLPVINGDILMLTGLTFLLALAVIQQTDDLRKVREEGKRAIDLSEAKTKFLASMSHEIRTPINAVLGMNEMILRENRDPAIEEYANSAKSAGQMLLMLVNDVLDFSKIEAGKMEINRAEFTFSSLLKNTMPMLKERADEKNLKLQTLFLNEVPNGQISDEFRIRQILINLISNAIKYTDTGSVTLMLGGEYTDTDTYMLKMNVKDTGRGISEEDQKTLFEAFMRADEKKNRNIEGTGLGLAIVKSIVDSMDGAINVHSKYGEGSEFIVHLPVTVTDRTPVSHDYEKQAEKKVSAGENSDFRAPGASLLVVDDNSANLKIVQLFLKRTEIAPDLCDSGTKAIELCRENHYDLIILDHMMPDPDGIKTLGIIKSDAASLNKDTPVVVLTANALAGSRQTYMDAGFVDYLTKPIDSMLLEQTVRRYLPADKVLAVDTEPETQTKPVSIREKLERIEGFDYDTAMGYTGYNEDLLEEIVGIIAAECDEKIDGMRACIQAQNWEEYRLTTHSIKGLMASIGLKKLSERAKAHEYAARDLDTDFIRSDCENFFSAYHDACMLLR